MATALKMTLYGITGNGQSVPLTDAELIAFVNRQNCNATRKHILTTALSLVGKVPYFWAVKPEQSNPYGLMVPLVVEPAAVTSFGVFHSSFHPGPDFPPQKYGTFPTSERAVVKICDGQGWSHVLIFAGYGEDGRRMWVHSSGGEGVILNSPSYEATLELRRPQNVDFDAPINIHTVYVIFNSGSAAIFYRIHRTVNHNLCSKRIMAGISGKKRLLFPQVNFFLEIWVF